MRVWDKWHLEQQATVSESAITLGGVLQYCQNVKPLGRGLYDATSVDGKSPVIDLCCKNRKMALKRQSMKLRTAT